MIHKFKGLYPRIFYFIFFMILYSAYCAEIVKEVGILQANGTEVKLGDYCWDNTCQVNQYCDRNFTCSCIPGFKVYNNECVLLSGEGGKCERHENCEGRLICLNGICRKPKFNSEFALLAKVCLGITITTIIIAIFGSLIKCIIRYDNSSFQRQNDASSFNATPAFNRNIYCFEATLHEVRGDKPPSYEECVRSTAPPPYIISNYPAILDSPIIQPTNMTNFNRQNETPLNSTNLNQKINSKIK